MDLKKKFLTKDDEGTWVDYDDARICILPAGSRKAKLQMVEALTILEINEMTDVTKPSDTDASDYEERLAVFVAEKIARMGAKKGGEFVDLKARMNAACIIDWTGITDDGKPVHYSQQKAAEYCYEYSEFHEFILLEVFKLDKTQDVQEQKAKVIKKK